MRQNLRTIFLFLALFTASIVSAQETTNEVLFSSHKPNSELYNKLKSLEGVVSVERLESNKFDEKYLINVKQFIDHNDTLKGTFNQRVIVSHIDYSKPVVMVCEGYGAGYGMNPQYQEEISKKLNANQIFIEHRFFLDSTPEPCDWSYMTGKNAADDLHVVNTLLKQVYSGKWISIGISKGGQNTMIYRTYYPNDVDISVPYVGPICFEVEDGRHEPFIAKCGTKEEQNKILEFQKEVLRRRDVMNQMLYELSEEKNYKFRVPKEEILDYCVLEFPFALYQLGFSVNSIPENSTNDKDIFNYLMKVSSAEYFGNHDTQSFFVQAVTDLGYYGYDTKPLKKLLYIKSAEGYLSRMFLPEDAKNIKFNKQLSQDIYSFLGNNDPKMIFIYGEKDPWSAVMPSKKLFKNKQNMSLYIQENGSHKARIGTMPEHIQNEIWNKINEWLK